MSGSHPRPGPLPPWKCAAGPGRLQKGVQGPRGQGGVRLGRSSESSETCWPRPGGLGTAGTPPKRARGQQGPRPGLLGGPVGGGGGDPLPPPPPSRTCDEPTRVSLRGGSGPGRALPAVRFLPRPPPGSISSRGRHGNRQRSGRNLPPGPGATSRSVQTSPRGAKRKPWSQRGCGSWEGWSGGAHTLRPRCPSPR